MNHHLRDVAAIWLYKSENDWWRLWFLYQSYDWKCPIAIPAKKTNTVHSMFRVIRPRIINSKRSSSLREHFVVVATKFSGESATRVISVPVSTTLCLSVWPWSVVSCNSFAIVFICSTSTSGASIAASSRSTELDPSVSCELRPFSVSLFTRFLETYSMDVDEIHLCGEIYRREVDNNRIKTICIVSSLLKFHSQNKALTSLQSFIFPQALNIFEILQY